MTRRQKRRARDAAQRTSRVVRRQDGSAEKRLNSAGAHDAFDFGWAGRYLQLRNGRLFDARYLNGGLFGLGGECFRIRRELIPNLAVRIATV